MAKYAVLWKFTEGAVRSMVAGGHPSPHTTRTLLESVGGNLEVYYWIAGSSHDGIAIVDVPDSSSATALKLAFRNASVVEYIESYELVATEDIPELLGRVGGMKFSPLGIHCIVPWCRRVRVRITTSRASADLAAVRL